jgi:modified peptide precursor CbpA
VVLRGPFRILALHRDEANVSKCKTKGACKTKQVKKSVIASRKSCSATGTGLSHYILTDRKAK